MMKKGIEMIGELIGACAIVCFVVGWQQKCIERWKEQAEKNRAMFVLMDKWASLRQDGRSLKEYFLKNRYQRIAVYGMGVIGQRLIKELKDSEIQIAYGIDNNKDMVYTGLEVVTMEAELSNVDAVIITVLKEFDAIREALAEKLDCPVIAIDDILGEF